MKKNLFLGLALLLLMGTMGEALAQRRTYSYWSVGASIGMCHYQGDLDDHGFEPWRALTQEDTKWGSPLDIIRPGFGLNLNYHFHPHMFLGLGAQYGWIGGDDLDATDDGSNAFRLFRQLEFRNRIFEVSATINYEFFATDRHYRFRPNWSPYVFTGIAVFYHNPYTRLRAQDVMSTLNAANALTAINNGWTEDYDQLKALLQSQTDAQSQSFVRLFEQYYEGDENIYLQPLNTEGQGSAGLAGCNECEDNSYSRIQLAIPIGIGLRRKITDKIDLRFQIGVRKTFTDHLDDAGSNYYADPDGFLGGSFETSNRELSYILSDRSQYRPITSGYDVQQVLIAENGPLNEDEGGEFRAFENQDDWYAFTSFTLTFIIDPGDRCPKFR